MKILLGSRSPRREEILRFFHLPFEVQAADFDESQVLFKGDIEKFVCTIAEEKGNVLQRDFPEHLIITADTVVFHENKPYFKPQNHQEAFEILKNLSGKTHSVYTAVSVRFKNKVKTKAERTDVAFNSLTRIQIEKYLTLEHGRDKAGSYGVQETGSLLVKWIDGCFYNVMGLPVNTLNEQLNQFGVDLWDFICD